MTRQQRHRDLLASVAQWQRASGSDRAWWRHWARIQIHDFRAFHLTPERAAFEAAVATQHRRNAP